jgi:uncharacterized membrane protein
VSAAAEVLLLWVAFAATHIGLSSLGLRPRLVRLIGERPFQGVYSLVALALFIPLVAVYFSNVHAGPWLLPFARGLVLRWITYLVMGLAFVLLVASLVRPSPAGVVPGESVPRGIYRITRHPMLFAFVLFGLSHALQNGTATDLAFFGGFVWFSLLGAWHQDRRKLATAGPGFRAFHEATPFLPFTGRETLLGVRELSPWIVALGIALTLGIRWFHGPLFGGF